jgi:secondary thiamine-phosphate synthase enzyme
LFGQQEAVMQSFEVQTQRRVVFFDITSRVREAGAALEITDGALLVFIPHTTAGVTINENADPSVRNDLEMALARIVPSSLPFTHAEGNSDAHVKASLMGSSAMIPVVRGQLQLGTWQGVYFAEFDGPRRRRVYVGALAGA